MNEFQWGKSMFRKFSVVFVGVVMAGGLCLPVHADGSASKPAKALDGERLYAINCSRCHSERYPTEHTEAEWKTLIMHMQVRANLPPDQARKIIKYMKDNN